MAELREIREDTTTRQVHVTTYQVRDCLASILDKKVQGVALNCIEAFVDFFCTWFYTTYNTMFDLKMLMHQHGIDFRHPERVSIHRFRNQAPLYDFTMTQHAGIRPTVERDLLRRMDRPGIDYVTFRARTDQAALRVLFSDHPDAEISFNEDTKYVAIQNDTDDNGIPNGCFWIREKETDGNIKTWHLNSQEIVRLAPADATVMGIFIGQEEVYIASPANDSTRAMATEIDETAFGALLNDCEGLTPDKRWKSGVMEGVHVFESHESLPVKAKPVVQIKDGNRMTIDGLPVLQSIANPFAFSFAFPKIYEWGRSFATVRYESPETYVLHHYAVREDHIFNQRAFRLTRTLSEEETSPGVTSRFNYYAVEELRQTETEPQSI